MLNTGKSNCGSCDHSCCFTCFTQGFSSFGHSSLSCTCISLLGLASVVCLQGWGWLRGACVCWVGACWLGTLLAWTVRTWVDWWVASSSWRLALFIGVTSKLPLQHKSKHLFLAASVCWFFSGSRISELLQLHRYFSFHFRKYISMHWQIHFQKDNLRIYYDLEIRLKFSFC